MGQKNARTLTQHRVPRNLAIHLAPAYGIAELVLALSRAEPDPHVSYRKSQRSQQAADDLARTRRHNPPAAESGSTRAAPSITVTDAAAAPTPKRARRAPDAESPAAATPAADAAPAAAADERTLTLEATTTVTAPAGSNIDMNAEIESAKQLVRDLKRELQMRAAAGDEVEETGGETGESSSRGVKRGNEDEGVAVSSGSKRTERVIKTNKRVEHTGTVGTVVRNTAYGAMIFGLGVGAA